MVVTKGDSPNRRRSIAVASHAGSGQSTAIPRRRRAYSVVPRTSLSPQAKARRLLVPRKSILKASFTPDDLDDTTQGLDIDDATQSMEFTQDFRAKIHDNASRKSFGRRVSFAEHAHVRVFQIPDKNAAANQSVDGQPESPQSPGSDPLDGPPVYNDENAYPQAGAGPSRRRSSVRFSGGSDDMDMTNAFSMHPPGSAILDEEFDDDDDNLDFDDDDGEEDMALSDEMDMDVTQIPGPLVRRRSSTGGALGNRRDTMPPASAILDMSDDADADALPSSEGGDLPASDEQTEEAGEQDVTHSSIANESIAESSAASNTSTNMEFTIPLNKSLRPPAHEDEAWMALRSATHSGDTPLELPASDEESMEMDYTQVNGGDMPLGDAVQRLMRARNSLSGQGQSQQDGGEGSGQYDEDTVSSLASMEGGDEGNQTLNISKVLGRVSMGGATDLSNLSAARSSLGYAETDMDESEVYGNVLEMRRQSMAGGRRSLAPRQSLASRPRESLLPSQASTSTAVAMNQNQNTAQQQPTAEPTAPEKRPAIPLVFKPPSQVFQPPPPASAPSTSTSTTATAASTTTSAPSIPHPASTSTPSKPQPTVPIPFSFTTRPTTPSRSASTPKSSNIPTTPTSNGKPKPKFTAAFAPPSARPSPKKALVPQKRTLPNENEGGLDVDADKPSPAKRQALAGKWPSGQAQGGGGQQGEKEGPRPLSPSKKGPFQSMGTETSTSTTTIPAPSTTTSTTSSTSTATTSTTTSASNVAAPSSALRRPTGYMARRKSLASQPPTSSAAGLAAKSPRRAVGRMSLASGPSDAWTRFDRNAPVPSGPSTSTAAQRRKSITRVPQEQEQHREVEGGEEAGEEGVVEMQLEENGAEEQAEQQQQQQLATVDLSTVNAQEFGEQGSGKDGEEDMDMDLEDEQLPVRRKTEKWREGVEEEGGQHRETPTISISQFFTMTGIKFMEDLAAPRRSLHPSQHPHLSLAPREPPDIPVSEYVVAMGIDIPQLELYTRVSRDLQAWVEKSKEVFREAEEEAEKVTPELFLEYVNAGEEGQAELLHQLNFIKINTRGHAKSDWYDWKLKWVESLKTTADQAFADLESDALKLESLSKAASEVIPDLEREYAEIMAELEKEQAEVAEIEACDQDYLNELKTSINEQNIEVEALKAELADHNDQLEWLSLRLGELTTEKRDIQSSIAKAERVLRHQKSSTRVEVFQLKDELEALEELHMVRVIKATSQLFEYIYDSTFRVTIPCKGFRPLVKQVTITRLESSGVARARARDDFPKLSNLFHTCAPLILDDDDSLSVPQIIHKLGDYWTCCAQLRSHLRLLMVKYPIEIDVAPANEDAGTQPTFRVRVSVLFPGVKGKAVVSYIFNLATFSQWPLSIDSLDCAVDVAYGALDRAAILKVVVDRLAEASSSDNYLLLDSCMEAQNLYADAEATA